MSWLRKRGQSTTPSPGYAGPPSEPVPMYNPNQAFSTENVTPFYPYTENREIVRNSSPNVNQLQQMPYIPTQSFAPQATIPLIPQEDITNPFKRASAQMQNANSMTSNQFMQTVNPPNEYPSRQHAFPQNFSQSVNLEAPPENSEQPDFLSNSTAPKPFSMPNPAQRPSPFQNWQDNSETVMNDRNQYLETGQLSDANQLGYMQEPEVESADQRPQQEEALPPPGLRRMVLGQMEQQENGGNMENFNDEPPPGLSGMVLGQNENGSGVSLNPSVVENDVNNSFEPISFPYGFRRMVPGESSSPENSTRQPNFQSQDINIGDSDPEFGGVPQLRSATIGADTPPATSAPINPSAQPNVGATDRSETIGAADEEDKPRGPSTSPTNSKKTGRKAKEKLFDNQTNDYVEGQHTESEIGSIVASVRNLTVGENSTDETNEVGVKPEPRRKISRPDSSESETEKRPKSPPRDRKDRRYKGDRREDRRERDHYSPDPTRDRRYDRRQYRDRNHDDSGDYYSDGERDKTKQDRDYDKKYYSLRKDKERDRRRKESPREYERENRRKRDEYYHRYEDSYDNEERSSRPSSRSDSMHDSMYRGSRRSEKDSRDRRRDRPRDREREKHRRPRDPYNPYNMPSYGGFDPYNPYYQQYQYQYYENLRRTNPQAYAEIYRKYYEQHAARHPPGYGPEDRSSVHSGRSSVNGDMAKDRFTRQSYYSHASVPYMADYYARESQTNSISGHYDLDESSYSRHKDQTDSFLLEDSSVKTGRTTPAKFLTAHTKVSIASGRIVKVLPNYPQDGQSALVELASLETYLQNDDEYKELSTYPGPLVKGITHKKTVIEYCENKIRNVSSNLDICDPDSYILMWELLILLLRQNGKVVGTDIAELLLKNRTENLPIRPSSVLSNISSTTGDVQAVSEASLPQVSEGGNVSSMSLLKEEEITNKFREYLLYGSEQEALEWAVKHGLWGHALFLASKLGKRTHSNVMVRFANGLTMNDPLQTLYQLLSGRIPSAVSGVAEEKWGDWKPHLAMMLSNSSLQPELNRKAITAMGDTLMARGSLYAAQFCFLMAEAGFGRYGADNVKMVLLGSNHNKPFLHFATNEAVHMTEIYEYACSLNDPDFTLPELQVYKYLLATRLADRGLLQKSLAFLERVALYITNNPTNVQSSLVNNVCNLADRLKYYDPVSVDDEEENAEQIFDNRLDNTWLKSLKTLQENLNSGLMSYHANSDMTLTDTIQSGLYDSTLDPARQTAWDQTQLYPQQYQNEVGQSPWQSDQQAQLDPSLDSYQQQVDQQQQEGFTSYQDQQAYWSNQQQQQWDANTNPQSTESLNQDQQNYYGSTNTQSEEEPRPQISIPGQSKGRSIFDDDEPLPHEKAQKAQQQQAKTEPAKQKESSSGWFGGIFSKLALKPKNQMKLPDDKNPSIVWDEEKKRWVNVDEDNNQTSNEIKPPPKMSDLMPSVPKPQIPQTNNLNNNAMPQGYTNPLSYNQNNNINVAPQPLPSNNNNQQMQTGIPNQDGVPQQSNIFKLQKSRNLKKSYIDVFNPGGATAKPAVPAPQMPGLPAANSASQMNFFIPQPVTDPNAPTNFLTQGNPVIQPQYDESAQLSRWSSASSLSREVQYYMRQKPVPYQPTR